MSLYKMFFLIYFLEVLFSVLKMLKIHTVNSVSERSWSQNQFLPCIFKMLVCSVVSDSFNSGDCSLPGSSVHGIFQARMLEWVVMLSSRRSSQPRDQSQVSHIAGNSLPAELPEKPQFPPGASQKIRPCRHLTSAQISDLWPLEL